MVSAPHTSSYHWDAVGTGAQTQRSFWFIARVYIVLGCARLALRRAHACQKATEVYADELKDIDFAHVADGFARANALNDDHDKALKYYSQAVNLGFWRGVELDDLQGLLQATGEKIRHLKSSDPGDIDQEVFTTFNMQAIALNLEKGDPTHG